MQHACSRFYSEVVSSSGPSLRNDGPFSCISRRLKTAQAASSINTRQPDTTPAVGGCLEGAAGIVVFEIVFAHELMAFLLQHSQGFVNVFDVHGNRGSTLALVA